MNEKPQRRVLRFSLRTLFELIAFAAFVLALIYYRTADDTDIGRYQLQIIPSQRGSEFHKWVIDTKTGQIWRYAGGKWSLEASKPIPKL